MLTRWGGAGGWGHGNGQEQRALSRRQWSRIGYLGLQYVILCRSKMLSQGFRGLRPRHEGKMITGSFVRHTANPDRDSDVKYNKRTKSVGQVWGRVMTGRNGNSLRCPPSQDGINTLSSSCRESVLSSSPFRTVAMGALAGVSHW